MTSPLVNPEAGYITLSRLDSSSSRPAICTHTRSVIGRLRGGLVRTQAHEPREAEPAVRSQGAVPNLNHEDRLHIGRAFEVLPGHLLGERRSVRPQWTEPGQQVALGRGRGPAADAAPVVQTIRPGRTDQQRAEIAAADAPRAD